jgi:hypothetical protein
MKQRFPYWTLGLAGILLLILVPVLYFLPRAQAKNDPAAYLPEKLVHVDHVDIVQPLIGRGNQKNLTFPGAMKM